LMHSCVGCTFLEACITMPQKSDILCPALQRRRSRGRRTRRQHSRKK